MMKKEIIKRKTINVLIKYLIEDDGVFCYNSVTATYLWGSKIGISDLKRHLEERDGGYFISKETLLKRKRLLQDRIKNSKDSLSVLNQVLVEIKEMTKDEKEVQTHNLEESNGLIQCTQCRKIWLPNGKKKWKDLSHRAGGRNE